MDSDGVGLPCQRAGFTGLHLHDLRRSVLFTSATAGYGRCREPWTHRTRPPLLGKPHRTRFPTAPTALIVIIQDGVTLTVGWSQKILSLDTWTTEASLTSCRFERLIRRRSSIPLRRR